MPALLAVLIWLPACQPGDDALDTDAVHSPQEKEALDRYILQHIKDNDKPFDWNEAPDDMLFRALELTNNILVIGYGDGLSADLNARDAILAAVYESEGKQTGEQAGENAVLQYKDDVLGFMGVKVHKLETLERVRSMPGVTFTEAAEYPISYELMLEYAGKSPGNTIANRPVSPAMPQDMILDPANDNPDYPDQVEAYNSGIYTSIRRHRIDEVYRTHGIYGEDIGVAVIDNGVVDWAAELFFQNGYGARELVGFYNPLWFLPWTTPDGTSPRSSDVFGISEMFEGQWLHGSGMMQSALVVAPNADITCARASTAIIMLTTSQIRGITQAIRAMADRPDIRVTNMSMGTIFMIHQIKHAITYYHNKGKIIACAAGTTPEEIKDLLGIIFPANLPTTVSVTGIRNRESTGGEFIAGSTAHTGPQNDFCVENAAASSEATARMVGMFAVLWSADPALTRDEVLDIMIASSHFYGENGQKDPEFGWGTVDMMEAVGMALE